MKKAFLNIADTKEPSIKTLWLLIFISYIFAIAVRYIWILWASKHPEFYWNNELMINTNDGYYWAEGARDILAGFHQPNDLSPINAPISKLTAFLAKFLPFSFESIILWMPGIFGSLLVVPVILIGRALKITWVGFIASLLAGISWSYYNRTMIGYYDTDMLVVVLPAFVLWGLVLAVKEKRNRYLLITTFTVIAYSWWYPGSYSLNFAMAFMLFLYTIIFDRKDFFNYKLLTFLFIAVMPIPIWLRIVISIGLFLYFHFYKEQSQKYIFYFLGISILILLFTGSFNPIIAQLKSYVFRSSVTPDLGEIKLHYFSVVQTVREAGAIPFDLFAKRISGSIPIFFLSLIGYMLLLFRYPVMMLSLPMIGLGFLAYGIPGIIPPGGLRFTVYAVPVMALGFGYLVFLIAEYVSNLFVEDKRGYIKIGLISLGVVSALYPNIIHVIRYKTPPVMEKEEVKLLDKLKHMARREDYVATWWDYGYPIRYYSDVKTLIDGAKHSGEVNFPVSFLLSHNQIAGANMARLDVEYTEASFKDKNRSSNYLLYMMQDYGFKDSNKFLQALNTKDFKLPKKTRDVYIYLPFKMIGIFQTVSLFSNLDLMSGKRYPNPFFYKTQYFRDLGNMVDLGNGMKLSKTQGILLIGKNKVPIHSFIVTEYDKNMQLKIADQTVYKESNIYVIFMKSYKLFLVMDEKMFNSLYIQLFVLDRYDPELFEPAIISPWAKIYRLKK